MNGNDSAAGFIRGRMALLVIAGVVIVAGAGGFALARASSEPHAAAAAPAGKQAQGMDMGGMKMAVDGTVHLTADQIRHFGVTFGTTEERTLENEVRTVGIVGFDETRMARITPKVSGYLEKLYVDFTGQPVRRGQPLVEIYSPELVAAEQELLLAAGLDRSLGESAVPGVSGRSELAAAARRRLELWDISDAQIDAILKSGKVRRTLTLHAPVSGIVTEKNVLQGQAVQPGETLYTIADLSRVWVEAELREQDAGRVREGSSATVVLNAFPGRPITGRVEYVYPTLQEQARTLKARITIPNHDGRIKPGMYAQVSFSTPARPALTVPTSAVVNTGERTLVFMGMGAGKLMPMDVVTGQVAAGYTEVLSGLEPGTRVVTSAQYLLDSESNMAEVMKSMIGMGGKMEMGGMEMKGAYMKDMPGMKMPTGKE